MGILAHPWAALNAQLRAYARAAEGKRWRPPAALLDRQSGQSEAYEGPVGYAAAQQIKGRKRQRLVDPLGLVPGVKVTPASPTERAGAKALLTGR